jgi:hypothetical protein
MCELPSDPWKAVERRLAELRLELAHLLKAIRATESKAKRLNSPNRKRDRDEGQGESAPG